METLSKLQQSELKATLASLKAMTDVAVALQLHNERVAGFASASRAKTRAKAWDARIEDEDLVLRYIESKFFSPDNTTWSLVSGRLIGYTKPQQRTWQKQAAEAAAPAET